MKPRNGMFIGAFIGLILAFILLGTLWSGAGLVFGILIGGFIGYEASWALEVISKTKQIQSEVNDKPVSPKKADKQSAEEAK